MTAAALLDELQARGAVLTVNGDRIQVEAPRAAITPELRAALVEHKPDILRLLRSPPQRAVPTDQPRFRFTDGPMAMTKNPVICGISAWNPGNPEVSRFPAKQGG